MNLEFDDDIVKFCLTECGVLTGDFLLTLNNKAATVQEFFFHFIKIICLCLLMAEMDKLT